MAQSFAQREQAWAGAWAVGGAWWELGCGTAGEDFGSLPQEMLFLPCHMLCAPDS